MKNCRICQGTNLKSFVDLGNIPLVNDFNPTGDSKTYPLSLEICEECNLIQSKQVIDPELMYRDYKYQTSASEPLTKFFKTQIAHRVQLDIRNKEYLALDIGCNDGSLLETMQDRMEVLGIEPSTSFNEILASKNIPFINSFFDKQTSVIISSYKKPKLIFALNVLAHIDKIHDTIELIKNLMEDSTLIIMVHSAKNILMDYCYDQIYHEHLSYFSVQNLELLFSQHGLELTNCEEVSIQGKSIYAFCRLIRNQMPPIQTSDLWTAITDTNINNYQKAIEDHKQKMRTMIDGIKKKGKRIIGYGAPAKANVLLNWCELNYDDIDYIVDTTPSKIGMKTPVTKIPIVSTDILKTDIPDYAIMFAWNYKHYIWKKEEELMGKGTKFIIPFPIPEMIGTTSE